MIVIVFIACLSLLIWAFLILGRGRFWLARERDDGQPFADPTTWPAVVAIVPARDEADVIARSIGSLLTQDYPGPFKVILVDDGSSDGTAQIAQALAQGDRLTVLPGAPLAAGWTEKLWAMNQGLAAGDGR